MRPINNDTFNKEEFPLYYDRVRDYLPNVPECVFENWIHRHYTDLDRYSFLGFDKMIFTREKWKIDKIYHDVNSFDGNPILDRWGYQLYDPYNNSWLKKYMLTNLTWNVPIIVLQNDRYSDMGRPYHLIEGHRRLNYFRELYRKEKHKLLDEHEIWLVTV